MFVTPVLILAFNRPKTLQVLIDLLREVKPNKIYFAVDGPRTGSNTDTEGVEQVKALEKQFDWGCAVATLYRTENLGCRDAVSSAIDWFFEYEEDGIILEDDCIVHLEFFTFANELLERYRYNHEIYSISASNFTSPSIQANIPHSYYFSGFGHIWGWATWRRAWKHYDRSLASYPLADFKAKLHAIFNTPRTRNYWIWIYRLLVAGKLNTWDFQWQFAIWMNNGKAIIPRVNMVRNIGFGAEASHTTASNKTFEQLQAHPIGFPLIHPNSFDINKAADHFTTTNVFKTQENYYQLFLKQRIKLYLPHDFHRKIKKWIGK